MEPTTALYNRKPVVAVNQKGEAIACYDSVLEAARINGFNPNNLYYAISHGTRSHRLRWMHEKDYREKWMNNSTEELRYSNRQINSDRVRKQWAGMTPERREQRCRRISESRKERSRLGLLSVEPAVAARSRPLICFNTGEEYPSVSAFARAVGAQVTNVSKAIRKGKRVKGLVVMYKDGNINKVK